jgi:1-hydroxycarotenoid 3,4-desaturase
MSSFIDTLRVHTNRPLGRPGVGRLPSKPRVVVIGAGVGGLCAAALLAHDGFDVQVLERANGPGGKMRQVRAGAQLFDAGPTVLTMRWVFDELFAQLGLHFDRAVPLRRCEVLARHTWVDREGPGPTLDLLADAADSEAAIAALAGGDEALRYRAFCQRAEGIYRALEQPFLRSPRPTPLSLVARAGWRGLPQLARIDPFSTLWDALGQHFHDPRLRQLFGRYATYCGSSPFDAPATLMLVAHVERDAVWQIEGGLYRLAQALAAAGERLGVRIGYGRHVQRILVERGRGRSSGAVCGVELAGGERIEADVVLFNGDAAALPSGDLGADVQQAVGGGAAARAGERSPASAGRSLSAVTWHLEAEASGFPLSHHNVFFSDPANDGYRREFDAIAQGRLPDTPTVYVCAQDRAADMQPGPASAAGAERVMCLVNAPARADHTPLSDEEIDTCQAHMLTQLTRAGLSLRWVPQALQRTTPQDFHRLFPASGGALYGPASRGWRATFQRPGSETPVPGLYLAGGTVHPGPGVPMAALSGGLAAVQISAAWASTHRWHPVVMRGGTSMR